MNVCKRKKKRNNRPNLNREVKKWSIMQRLMIRNQFNEDKIRVFLCFLTVEADERDDLVLRRTTDLGKTFTTIHEDIFSFGYIGAFLFFSVMEDSVR